ncbi:MAG: N-acetylmuramoyl-L-alanine amidase, partial [Chloroflexaceae bacterium]|nr:N-acetylmuramoyl-L-alanine amidase [Chloroflexaceae bacterium]
MLNPGHGYFYDGGWKLARGLTNGVREDFTNVEFAIQTHARLAARGATVYATRELNKSAGNHSSGYPLWQMGASVYTRHIGLPQSIWGGDGEGSDINARPRYANHVNANLVVNLHTNAGGGCGTETWYDTANGYQDQSRRLAELIQSKVVQTLRSEWGGSWSDSRCYNRGDRGVKGSNGVYGENRWATRPAALIEIAFHDNPSDAQAILDPRFQALVAQAIDAAIVEYVGGSVSPPPNQLPNQPVLTAPANGFVTTQGSVRLEWRDGGDPDNGPRGHRDFEAELWRGTTRVSYRTWGVGTVWDVSGLAPGTYTWKVRSGDGKDASAWAERSFTIALPNQPPNKPTQSEPAANQLFASVTPVALKWADGGDPDNGPRAFRDYYVELFRNGTKINELGWTTATEWDLGVLAPGTYAWRVQSGDGAEGSGWTAQRPFRVNAVPNKPTLTEPANGVVTSQRSVRLAWRDNGDPDNGPRAFRDYYGELFRDGTKIRELEWTTDTAWQLNDLADGLYEWRVQSGDGAEGGGWSAKYRFRVDTTAPTLSAATLNYGWGTAAQVAVPLAITASDTGSGVATFRTAATCAALGDTWQPYRASSTVTLSGQHGDTARVCVQVRDAAGNASATAERTVMLDFYPAQP